MQPVTRGSQNQVTKGHCQAHPIAVQQLNRQVNHDGVEVERQVGWCDGRDGSVWSSDDHHEFCLPSAFSSADVAGGVLWRMAGQGQPRPLQIVAGQFCD